MATRRELVAAMLMTLSNDSFVTGFKGGQTLGLGRKGPFGNKFIEDRKGTLEPAWVLGSVVALPEAFVVALRESPNRQKFLDAADILMTNIGIPAEGDGAPCTSERH